MSSKGDNYSSHCYIWILFFFKIGHLKKDRKPLQRSIWKRLVWRRQSNWKFWQHFVTKPAGGWLHRNWYKLRNRVVVLRLKTGNLVRFDDSSRKLFCNLEGPIREVRISKILLQRNNILVRKRPGHEIAINTQSTLMDFLRAFVMLDGDKHVEESQPNSVKLRTTKLISISPQEALATIMHCSMCNL